MNLPNKKYQIIYADPAWEYKSDPNSKPGIWGLAQNHYSTMSVDEIKKLPIEKIVSERNEKFLNITQN